MRTARVRVNTIEAGLLTELSSKQYRFVYRENYRGAPVSLTMPITTKIYEFDRFPPFFEGLLPEGILLEALLRKCKLDRKDYFGQLLQVGRDVVGAVSIEEITPSSPQGEGSSA
jgi:serine/threonine-protein kinase HipA